MGNALEEIHIIYRGEFRRRDEWCAAKALQMQPGSPAQSPIDFNGTFDSEEMIPGCEYRLYGKWETHERFGKQFKMVTFTTAQPGSRTGVIRYLMQAPNVGDRTAEVLWDKFGPNAVKILREQPEVAAAAINKSHFSGEKAAAAAVWLEEQVALESCSIELMDLLGSRGFPKATAREAVKKWGNLAAEVIKRNPYCLMAFRGIGFLKADAMYLDLGRPPARLKRQALAGWYAIASEGTKEGHTWLPVSVFEKGIRDRVAGARIEEVKALKLAKRAGLAGLDALDLRWQGNSLYIAESKKSRAESFVARAIAESLEETHDWPEIDDSFCQLPGDKRLTDHQREQIAKALQASICCFGGSPGTGKTTSATAIVRAILQLHGWGAVVLAAPTGKAAVRLTETLSSNEIGLRARTIHSVLGVQTADDGGGWSFKHNAYNPLPFKYIIIDESSMIDTSLMSHLLAARAKGTCVLFIGDVGQLPPVGQGAPLRDFIRYGVPHGELREIKRNSGSIVNACAAIRDNDGWTTDQNLCPEEGRNLKLVPANNGKDACEEIVSLLRRIRDTGVADPIWECQVLVAVNKKSDLSRKALNERLQGELNPAGAGCEGSPFRVGDKVICTRNTFLTLDESHGTPKNPYQGKTA